MLSTQGLENDRQLKDGVKQTALIVPVMKMLREGSATAYGECYSELKFTFVGLVCMAPVPDKKLFDP